MMQVCSWDSIAITVTHKVLYPPKKWLIGHISDVVRIGARGSDLVTSKEWGTGDGCVV
jgi:hypothetical protein